MHQTVRPTRAVRCLSGLVVAALCTACSGEEDLPGEYFDLVAVGDENSCTGEDANLEEKFEYRVVLDGNTAEIAIGPDIFATGRLEGCLLVYESVVWEEARDGGEIAWQIVGSATVNIDDACPPPVKDEDWVGREDFEIVSADDSVGLAPGCSYSTMLKGRHTKGVK
ncbi:MAG: hypothetical protein ACI8PZ_005020 [Myxococcota bacterium]|jgi:hypothetical protein